MTNKKSYDYVRILHMYNCNFEVYDIFSIYYYKDYMLSAILDCQSLTFSAVAIQDFLSKKEYTCQPFLKLSK